RPARPACELRRGDRAACDRLGLVHRRRDDDRRAAADLAREGHSARLRRAGAHARRVGCLLPGERAARLDAVDREDLAGDVRAARQPAAGAARHRSRVGRRVAAARDRRVLDPDRARRLQGRRAVREEARQAQALRMIELRVVATDADYESWAAIKTRVIPGEAITAEQLRASDEDGRLLLLAAADDVDAGCGVGSPSGFAGLAFFGVRVLPEQRGRGVARELVRALCDHARALGREGVNAFVHVTEPESIAVAEHYGLHEVDYQLQQARTVGDEPPAPLEVVSLDGRREELLRAAWPLAQEAWADLPLPGEVTYPLATWLRDEATVPAGSFVVFDGAAIVGYAGLVEHGDDGTAEHGLT